MKAVRVIALVVIVAVCVFVLGSCVSNCSKSDNSTDANRGITHGELLDVKDGPITVIKVKIEPSLTDDLTIAQNYHNVENFVKQNDLNGVDELQYWAVAGLSTGEEGKVISFTLKAKYFDGIRSQNIVATQLPDYVDDLWITPALTD